MPECGEWERLPCFLLGLGVGGCILVWSEVMRFRLWRRIKKHLYDKEARLNYMLREVGEVYLSLDEIGWE